VQQFRDASVRGRQLTPKRECNTVWPIRVDDHLETANMVSFERDDKMDEVVSTRNTSRSMKRDSRERALIFWKDETFDAHVQLQ